MKTTFSYDTDAATTKACEYSEAPETLRALIARLKIEVGPNTIVPSPWNESPRPLKALHMLVTVEGYTFSYYGSHSDAQAFTGGLHTSSHTELKAKIAARKDFREGLLYSLLCCIGSDISATQCDPEDMGMNPDSIKDMAKWNEIKEHARKLHAALRLTRDEMESLPS